MIRWYILLVITLFAAKAPAQYTLEPLFEINEEVELVLTDNLLNIYTVNGPELKKYDKTGVLQFQYSDKQLGNIGNVDLSFPMRPLLHYPGINYVAILDNTLSNNRGNINLLNRNIQLGTLACTSIQNHFWIYDAMDFKLLRTNENFNSVAETGNLAQILRIPNFEPSYMIEFANKLYISNPSSGVLQFDIFGTYMRSIPVLGLKRFQIHESEMVYFHDQKLVRYHFKTYAQQEVPLPPGSRHAELQKNRVVVLFEDKVVAYQLK